MHSEITLEIKQHDFICERASLLFFLYVSTGRKLSKDMMYLKHLNIFFIQKPVFSQQLVTMYSQNFNFVPTACYDVLSVL